MRQHKRSAAAGAVVTAVATALGIVAFAHDGFETTNVDLHDGGVWVTNQEIQHVGHLNVEVEELDASFVAQSSSFDVLQQGDDVLLHDQSGGLLSVVETASATTGDTAAVPSGAEISLGGGVVSILDPSGGMLYALPVEQLDGFDVESVDPVAQLGTGASAVVDVTGQVHAVSPDRGELLAWSWDGGAIAEPEARTLADLELIDKASMTAVGTEPVVLDAEQGFIVTEAQTHQVGEDAVLQHPGPASDFAAVSTPTDLLRIPLGGGGGGDAQQQAYGSGGKAVAPVQVNGCVHTVWASEQRLVRDCADDSRDLDASFELPSGTSVTLRELRGVVALNNLTTGTVYLVSDELIRVDNWADLLPPPPTEFSEEEGDAVSDTTEERPPPELAENEPPVAEDDDVFGARKGRSTLLPVLWNDSDPNGDVLTVAVDADVPDGVRVTAVENDSQLQIEIPDDFEASSVSFEYRVDDGRGGSDTAMVTVPVRDDDENSEPEPLRDQAFTVEQRASYEYLALQDWYDPDGDDMFLTGAGSAGEDTVQFNPDGTVVYTATGEPGPQTLQFSVSDGRETATGEADVEVIDRGTSSPVANDDFVSLIEGEQTTVRPLLNDYSPSGGDLRLASATARGDLEISVDLSAGTVRVVSGAAGTHFIDYTIVAGSASAKGVVRVDVVTANGDDLPVAVRDFALLPMGGDVTVDVLANDIDPAGGVLVVQSIELDSAQVSARLKSRQFIELGDSRGLQDPFEIEYWVANGSGSSVGQITVIPVAPPESARPPTAVDDKATLRSGDYLSIDVTDNDFSSDGVSFELAGVVETSFADDTEGIAFIADGDLRVHVPEGEGGAASVTYEVVDELGQRDTATVSIDVRERALEQNRAPVPQDVTARVLAGSTVTIPIPLDGIDPDGDGVTLVGITAAPEEGRIVEVRAGAVVYEAYEGTSGSVTFGYSLRDRWNATSTGSVTVGIAQPADVNQPPFAQTDHVTVQPGRQIVVSALANDSDPDGDTIALVDTGFDSARDDFGDVAVSESGRGVFFTSPEAEGQYTIPYRVEDSRGAQGTGMIVVTVDTEAKALAPVAVDDIVDPDTVAADEALVVPVLENDLDEDGNPADLTVEVVTGPGQVTGSSIQIVPTEEFQIVAYRVTDADGLTSQAFVFVPGQGSQAPYLSPEVEMLTIGSGKQLQIMLNDVIVAPSGRGVQITTDDRVSATRSNGEPLVVSESELSYTSEQGYVGQATVNVEVTDGSEPNDPDGNVALISIPLNVIPSSAVEPTFEGAVVEVEAGQASEALDLRDQTEDPDVGDLEAMAFEHVSGEAEGIGIDISDGVLTARAGLEVSAGTEQRYGLVITDPAGNSVDGVVIVRVVSSRAPLVQAVADTADGVQGEPITIEPLSNDVNPFVSDGGALKILDVTAVSGDASALETDGSTVSVTPAEDFSGRLSLQYRVQDATEAPDREVTGAITVTVRGVPDAPPRPNVSTIGDQQTQLSWAAPADNGSPITGYRVDYDGGSQMCESTTCTVTGLQNGIEYRFTVTAINEIGESEPSAETIFVRPDVPPETPGTPRPQRGDGEVLVQWQAPENRGSAITHYVVEISPPGPNGISVQEVSGTQMVWDGLVNGDEYQFRVQAHNDADDPSGFSQFSSPVIPAGPPSDPSDVRAERTSGSGQNADITVTWAGSSDNGAPITGYTVTATQGGERVGEPVTVGAERRDAVLQGLPVATTPYVFTVHAANAVGDSARVSSAPLRAVNPPDAPTAADGPDQDGYSVVTLSAGSTNGARQDEVQYYYTLDGGSRIGPVTPGEVQVTAANREKPYNVQFVAVTTVDGVAYPSAASNTVQVQPFGDPVQLNASATNAYKGVDFRWDAPVASGRTIKSVMVSVNGGTPQSQPATAGSMSVAAGYGEGVSMQIWSVDVDGNESAKTEVRGVAWDAPTLTARTGSSYTNLACVVGCHTVYIEWTNLPDGTYDMVCNLPEQRNGSLQVSSQNGQGDMRNDLTGGACGVNGTKSNATVQLIGQDNDVNLTSPEFEFG
ncbi:MAG: Ig-like domain-containing protein [Agrococcus casei]|uniref:Ig-like domain-containing protein n=1 Tax=Agrococcus casei TaxID=343512 RepID=UPI003F9AE9C8